MSRMSEAHSAEVLSVGNELLIGHTLDTNSFWIGKQLVNHGWTLKRVTQLRDSIAAIGDCVRDCLERRPAMVFTVGGLGPTHDDMTLRGIAAALKRPLTLNRDALHYITERYARLDATPSITRSRRKMAMIPRGSIPIPNPVGTAPGVVMKFGKTTIVSLPGVPGEMKGIFKESILPLLRAPGLSERAEVTLRIVGAFESYLAPILSRAQRKFPKLYFKSHPRGRETGVRSLVELHIYTLEGGSVETVRHGASFVVEQLQQVLESRKLP